MFVAFDLLELDGKDLRGEPLETRRRKLQELPASERHRLLLLLGGV